MEPGKRPIGSQGRKHRRKLTAAHRTTGSRQTHGYGGDRKSRREQIIRRRRMFLAGAIAVLVIVVVLIVNVSSQNIFVLPFGYCVCKLPSDFMGGLIIDLSRLKGLYQMVG